MGALGAILEISGLPKTVAGKLGWVLHGSCVPVIVWAMGVHAQEFRVT